MGQHQLRAQIDCLSPDPKLTRWLLSLPHQPLWPVAHVLGIDLPSEYASTRISGGLSFDVGAGPNPVPHGRVQLVLDRWPLGVPEDRTALWGTTLSLLSNVVRTGDGTTWDLPRVEISGPVFNLTGQGRVDWSLSPRLVLKAAGERTCKQLAVLLDPGDLRDRVSRLVANPAASESAKVDTKLLMELQVDRRSPFHAGKTAWHLSSACGIQEWPEAMP